MSSAPDWKEVAWCVSGRRTLAEEAAGEVAGPAAARRVHGAAGQLAWLESGGQAGGGFAGRGR